MAGPNTVDEYRADRHQVERGSYNCCMYHIDCISAATDLKHPRIRAEAQIDEHFSGDLGHPSFE